LIFLIARILQRHGPALLAFLISLGKSIFKALAGNEYIARWKNHHPKAVAWLKARFERTKFTGLPLTLTSLIALYILFLLAGLTKDFINSEIIVQLDVRLAEIILLFRTMTWLNIFYWITLFGESWIVAIFAALLSVILISRKQLRKTFILWFVLGGSFVTAMLGKYILQRPRPSMPALIENTFSYPSGHATLAAAFFGILIYILWDYLGTLKRRSYAIFAAVVIIILISLSRLYLGVHYLSDVTSGALIGLLWLVLGISVSEWLRKQKNIPALNESSELKIQTIPLLVAALLSIILVMGIALTSTPEFRIQENLPVSPKTINAPVEIFETDQLPRTTETLLGIPQEPLSVIIMVADDAELIRVLEKAGWLFSDEINVATLIELAQKAAYNQPYPTAPMSPSFWNGRTHDFGFQQSTETNSARHRHHARFWKSGYGTPDGKNIYVGTVSLDNGVKWVITHTIDPNIDGDRDLLVADVRKTGEAATILSFQFVSPTLGKNFAGDQFFTDGKAFIIELK